MAKQKRNKQKKKQQQAPGRARRSMAVSAYKAGLDKAALDYAKLLEDPCRADLVRPVYNFGTSGYLCRVKQVVTLGGNSAAVDAYTAFMPGGEADSTVGTGMWHHGYAAAAGGSLGTITGQIGPAFLRTGTVGHYRPVAGCLRVHYTGTELNRSGMVSLGIAPSAMVVSGETGVGTVATMVPSSTRTVRLGSEPHEVRFLPLSSTDQLYSSSSEPQTGTFAFGCTVLYVLAQGVPAGTVNVELDFVYEWVPNMDFSASSMEITIAAPPSRNTLADVLRFVSDAYGGLQAFATSNSGRKVLGVLARGAYAVANSVGAPLAIAAM